MRYLWLPLLVFGVLLAPVRAWAEPPAGIVMAIAGTSEPSLAAMQEIPANTAVRLGPGTEVTFLHYVRCKLVTVTGGTLTLTRADYKADGRVGSEADGPCSRVVALSDVGGEGRNAGGLIARGLEPPPHWPVDCAIIFSGSRGGQVRAAAIVADDRPDQPLLRLDLAGARAQAPPAAAKLLPGTRYRLRLTLGDRRAPAEVPFIGAVPSGAGSLVVLRVD